MLRLRAARSHSWIDPEIRLPVGVGGTLVPGPRLSISSTALRFGSVELSLTEGRRAAPLGADESAAHVLRDEALRLERPPPGGSTMLSLAAHAEVPATTLLDVVHELAELEWLRPTLVVEADDGALWGIEVTDFAAAMGDPFAVLHVLVSVDRVQILHARELHKPSQSIEASDVEGIAGRAAALRSKFPDTHRLSLTADDTVSVGALMTVLAAVRRCDDGRNCEPRQVIVHTRR